MVQDLRLEDTFFVSKNIFLDSRVSRKARGIYVALCMLTSLNRKDFNIENLSRASGYNKQIVSRALKELNDLGFIKRSRTSIDLVI